MTTRFAIATGVLMLAVGCRQPAEGGRQSANSTMLVRCNDNKPQGFRENGNWCYNTYPEALLVNIPPDNNKARYFRVPEGVVQVIVTMGKTTAAFLLERKGPGPLKLYTSNNFPQCLSTDSNFTLYGNGNGFEYNNNYFIKFSLTLSPDAAGYVARLDYLADIQYGIEVRRCSDCK